jgi:signal transduction histidine kinase/ActR/RegA family two-component response regulator
MAYEEMNAWTRKEEESSPGSWRRGWASAGALIATITLIVLVAMVTLSGRARDDALAWERHTYDVMLLTRTADATMARAEAALGRFVLDEDVSTSGSLYYDEWRRAGRQIGQLRRLVREDDAQRAQVDKLQALYKQRGAELAQAAAAAVAKRGSEGLSLFYQAGRSETGPELRATLDAIAVTERDELRQRMAQTRMFDEQADNLTEWLGWLGVLVGIGAILLGIAAYRALTDRLIARQQAETESERATALDRAVQERTRELSEANERLQAEAAERASAEAQLRQVQKMEAVGQLTGGIAHDFNNMLAVVVGGLDIARRKLSGPRQDVEFHLDRALEGATRAAALTRRLLAFARAEALLPEAVSPSGLVEGMRDLVDRTIGERIKVEIGIAEEPWTVWADANQLENAILNLAVNARDAMDGEGTIGITIQNLILAEGEVGELAAGDYVRIAVSDTGSGIAPEHLDKVFEPFFTTKPVGKGTGLGLSQIFGFARQSGGDVTIESALGIGTTVSILLPRATGLIEQAPVHVTRADAEGPEARQAAEGIVVLVVEDDPRVCRSTVSALEELGYQPLACASGPEALQVLGERDRVDLVITDVMMPEMTGPELVREIAREYPEIAILFVTGYVGEAGEAADLGGYDMLRKPFTVSALAQAVSAALGRRSSESPAASEAAAAG